MLARTGVATAATRSSARRGEVGGRTIAPCSTVRRFGPSASRTAAIATAVRPMSIADRPAATRDAGPVAPRFILPAIMPLRGAGAGGERGRRECAAHPEQHLVLDVVGIWIRLLRRRGD